MVELTVDGIRVTVPEGSFIINAAQKAGVYIPHFCYHKKLSVAANCRMCLVEIDKMPKVLPACATTAKNNMIVNTCSQKTISAQKSVMEFLLINHPLDCPVCDQGGECQLQDLAVGYGGFSSRYKEEKRLVFKKNLGPLIGAEEMTRCIHCTRCVRFGQEIAGVTELGMLGRGEHSEITSFVGHAIESELSGNMIDICPVGALTSKPFRFQARTWELTRRFSISPHDSLGTNLVLQIKSDHIARVVPFENEALNECWISDRDRFSYDGLNSEDRLSEPMLKDRHGQWQKVSWDYALKTVTNSLKTVLKNSNADQIGALATEYATLEEYALLSKLVRGLGSENIDFRLRQTDPNFDNFLSGIPWLGMPITELENLDKVLIIGSFLRKDHPLIAQRLRKAVKRGAKIFCIDSTASNQLMPIAGRITVAPSKLPHTLLEIITVLSYSNRSAREEQKLPLVEPSDSAKAIASGLLNPRGKTAVFLGSLSINSPYATALAAYASTIATLAGANFGFLVSGANTVGGYLANAIPNQGGKNAASMLSKSLKAYIVLHAEPLFDTDNGLQASEVLRNAQFTVAMTSYYSAASEWAHVMLPVAPFTETSGTFVNIQGLAQSFKGVVRPLGETRPGWKVLRVLGNLLNLPGFEERTSESIRDAVLANGISYRLSNFIKDFFQDRSCQVSPGLERIADTPIYRSDAIVRRSRPLQKVLALHPPAARMNADTLKKLGVTPNTNVFIATRYGNITIKAIQDEGIAEHAVHISSSIEQTLGLGSAFSTITTVERV